jgi:alpha-beta hydrolase superfamily lysophospholipase
MKKETFEFVGCNKTKLAAIIWLPEGECKKILQITHGMTEHINRYTALAEELTAQRIIVAGFDLRGHGKNAGNDQIASCGEGGWAASIEDMRLFFGLLEERFPKVPHFMLGFSLGSFLLREYLGKYPEGVAGAIIMGTGNQPGWLLSIMMAVIKGQIKKAGFDGTTELVRQLSFGTYNQKFKPNRTTADWLCSDEAELDKYLADPLVRKDISAGLFWELLGSMKRTGSADSYRRWNKEMPVYLMYGTKDAVGDFGKGVQQVYNQMKKAGLCDIEFEQYIDGRHDILHEERSCAESVRHSIADWLMQEIG